MVVLIVGGLCLISSFCLDLLVMMTCVGCVGNIWWVGFGGVDFGVFGFLDFWGLGRFDAGFGFDGVFYG